MLPAKRLGVRDIKKALKKSKVRPQDGRQLAFAVENMGSDEYILLDKDYQFVKGKNIMPMNVCDYTKIGKQRTVGERISLDSKICSHLSKGFKVAPYFGWMGFDKRKRIMTYLSLVEGFRLESLSGNDIDVKVYRNCARAKVPSSSEADKSYEIRFGSLPLLDSDALSDDFYVLVADLRSGCGCAKKFYEGYLYDKYVNPVNMFCHHEIAAYHKLYKNLDKKQRIMINPFAVPNEKGLDYVWKCGNVIYKGRLLNKGETNMVLSNICSAKGFNKYFVLSDRSSLVDKIGKYCVEKYGLV